MACEGLLVVISAPSGTGKGTLVEALKERNHNVKLSVSATTRKPRENEVDGQDYFFKTVDEFNGMIENGELIEWVRYCDNFYGTPRDFVEDTVKAGYDVLFEIEVDGAFNIRKEYPDSVLIFILPPSFDELKKRITGRGTEAPDVIEKRLEQAKREMKYIDGYDYVVVNDSIDAAVNDINDIIRVEKLKVKRNSGILKTKNLLT